MPRSYPQLTGSLHQCNGPVVHRPDFPCGASIVRQLRKSQSAACIVLLLLLPFLIPACDTATGAPGSNNTSGANSNNTGGPLGAAGPSTTATVLEQLSLERINRARLRPAQEAARFNIALDEGVPGQINATPKQPVALNAALNSAARGHSQDMLDRNYFAHDTPEGVSPFTRMTNAGFTFITAGENLAWRGTQAALVETQKVDEQHQDLFVDAGIVGRGHRVTMLNDAFKEVGIGILRGPFTDSGTTFDSIMQTQDYGTSPNSPTFVLGVVYGDANGNGQYDAGEGVANAAVSLDGVAKTANAGGGYSFAVSQTGAYELRFSGGQSYTVNVAPGQKNIKVDLVNGLNVVVNLGLGPLN